jgi:hypothetical protein
MSTANGVLLAVLLLGAVFTLSMPDEKLWQRVVENSGHGPVFALLAVVLVWLQAPTGDAVIRPYAQYLRVFALAVGLGVVTELVQWALPNRNVSAADVLHDAAGAALGLASFWWIERRLARRRGVAPDDALSRVVVAIALGAFVLLAWQPLQCARAYAARAAAWPALLPAGEQAMTAFVQVHDGTMSRAQLPVSYRRADDGDSVRLSFGAGVRPGVQWFEPVPDWSGYSQLVLDVTNPSPVPVHFVLRVFDATHDWTHEDRFNQALVIPAGSRSTVRISLEAVAASPQSRRMDMTAIADVMLFASRPLDAGELYLTRVWLE